MQAEWTHAIDSLLPGKTTAMGPTRRTALKTALGVGYVASALPTLAQTAIVTPDTGLRTGTAGVQVGNGLVPVYHAAPHDAQNLPVVLVVHEIFGVHAYIADTCRRVARAGYLAIAPDLFARQGDASRYTDIGKLMAEVVSKVPDAQALADLDAVLAWAATQGGNVKHAAMTGFCWGGRIVWLYAAHNPSLKAGVAWYGRLAGTATAATPRHPLDLAASLHAPVLGLYGGQDGGIPMATVEAMQQALAAAGAKGHAAAQSSKMVVYPDAGHAFHADYRSSYNQAAAQDGFARALAWFQAQGVV